MFSTQNLCLRKMIWIAVTIQHSISVQHGTLLHCTIALSSLCSSFSYMSHSLPHTSWRTETLSCSSLRGPGVRMEAWERKKWNYSVLYVDSISVFHPTRTLSLSHTLYLSVPLPHTHAHAHTHKHKRPHTLSLPHIHYPRFKKGAFQMAKAAGVKIVPVSIGNLHRYY